MFLDDFHLCGTAKFKKLVIDKLFSLFLIRSKESEALNYIGLNIRCNTAHSGIIVDQIQCASFHEHIPNNRERLKNKPSHLSEFEKKKYEHSSLIGKLNLFTTQTRPDIAFVVCEVSGAYSNGEFLKLNKFISHVVTDYLKLRFHHMSDRGGFLLSAAVNRHLPFHPL